VARVLRWSRAAGFASRAWFEARDRFGARLLHGMDGKHRGLSRLLPTSHHLGSLGLGGRRNPRFRRCSNRCYPARHAERTIRVVIGGFLVFSSLHIVIGRAVCRRRSRSATDAGSRNRIAYPLHLSYLVLLSAELAAQQRPTRILRLLGVKESSQHEIPPIRDRRAGGRNRLCMAASKAARRDIHNSSLRRPSVSGTHGPPPRDGAINPTAAGRN